MADDTGFLAFARANKKWWLALLLLVIAIFALLLALLKWNIIAPYTYNAL